MTGQRRMQEADRDGGGQWRRQAAAVAVSQGRSIPGRQRKSGRPTRSAGRPRHGRTPGVAARVARGGRGRSLCRRNALAAAAAPGRRARPSCRSVSCPAEAVRAAPLTPARHRAETERDGRPQQTKRRPEYNGRPQQTKRRSGGCDYEMIVISRRCNLRLDASFFAPPPPHSGFSSLPSAKTAAGHLFRTPCENCIPGHLRLGHQVQFKRPNLKKVCDRGTVTLTVSKLEGYDLFNST